MRKTSPFNRVIPSLAHRPPPLAATHPPLDPMDHTSPCSRNISDDPDTFLSYFLLIALSLDLHGAPLYACWRHREPLHCSLQAMLQLHHHRSLFCRALDHRCWRRPSSDPAKGRGCAAVMMPPEVVATVTQRCCCCEYCGRCCCRVCSTRDAARDKDAGVMRIAWVRSQREIRRCLALALNNFYFSFIWQQLNL